MPFALFLAGIFAGFQGLTLGHQSVFNAHAGVAETMSRLEETITVTDQTISYRIPANGSSVGEILSRAGFLFTEGDILIPAAHDSIVPGSTITILHATPLTLIDGGTKSKKATQARTVGAMLTEQNIALHELDILSPVSGTNIVPDMTVRIRRRTTETATELVNIDFPRITHDDPDISYGKLTVISEGRPGQKHGIFEIVKEDGVVIQKKLISSETLREPVAQEETRGVKITIGRSDEGFGSWYNAFPGMYAASTTYPRKSFVRVTNLTNNKSVIVKINDYGPTIPGRIIDLEATAFKALAPLGRGVIPVRVEQLL